MQIKQIRLDELLSFVESQSFKDLKTVPITPARAKSQVLNPRADRSDIVLTVAYNANKDIIAYVGALPDKINDEIKISWNSCWYANKNEGRKIALPLFLQFVKNYNNKVIFQDLTPHTTQILKALPSFQTLEVKNGVRVFFRSVLSLIIIQKYPKFRYVKWFLQLVDSLINLLLSRKLNRWRENVSNTIKVERIENIDAESEEFINKHNKKDFVKRNQIELNWILNNKWVELENNEPNIYKDRYHFTSRLKDFQYHLLKFKRNNNLIGIVLLRLRDKNLETPYIYLEELYKQEISTEIIKYTIQLKANTITSFNNTVVPYLLSKSFPYIYCRKLTRDIVASTELINEIESFGYIQDGDGDVVFT